MNVSISRRTYSNVGVFLTFFDNFLHDVDQLFIVFTAMRSKSQASFSDRCREGSCINLETLLSDVLFPRDV